MHAALKQERISQTWRDYLLPEKPSACIRFQLWAYCTGFASALQVCILISCDIMWYHVILKFVVMKLWPCIASVFSFCNVWHLLQDPLTPAEKSAMDSQIALRGKASCAACIFQQFSISHLVALILWKPQTAHERCILFSKPSRDYKKLWHSMELTLALKCHDDTVSCVSFFRCVFWSNMMWTAWTWLTSAFQANIRSWCRAYPMYSTSVQQCIVEENPRGYAQELLSTPSNDYLSSRFSDVFSSDWS